MRFLVMHKLDQHDPAAWSPSKALIDQMGAFLEEAAASGVLLAAEGVLPPKTDGALVRWSSGEATVTDGPFAEAKEVIAGFALIQVESRDAAVAFAKRFGEIAGGDLEVELRRVAEFDDFDPAVFPPESRAREQALRDRLEGA